ncbi:triose-phosphate isomerase [bacterium]|nr:MAG: triose-phosphate isomerase [bacterium]
MPKTLIVANWKMHKTVPEAVDLVQEMLPDLRALPEIQVAIAPPFVALSAVAMAVKETGLFLAAQNMFWEQEGAYTGEISPVMLRDLGCRFVILGHSERRQYFGEGEGEVGRKVYSALQEGLVPILCVGETLGEREYGKTFEIIERQIRGGLEDIVLGSGEKLVVAYEPVWAIGTGKTSSPEAAQEVHGFIRGLLRNVLGEKISEHIRIIYGGSVKPDNVVGLMAMKDINGALVGGASLDADSFTRIVNFGKD